MRLWLFVTLGLAFAACKTSDNDGFPVDPGGRGVPGTSLDAFVQLDGSTSDGGNTITGRVCLVEDLRALTLCAATGAGSITVTLGTRTAVTNDNGGFTITTPSGSNLTWRATGAGIVKSVTPFGPTNLIPAISVADYSDLKLANGIVEQAGQGSVVARIVKNTTPVTSAVAALAPGAQFPPKYDGLTATAWTDLKTSTAGTAWIAGAGVGTPMLTVTPMTGTGASEVVRVEDGAITFVTVELP